MPTAYLLLGSNLGDRTTILREAIDHLNATAGTVVASSARYETAAWGLEDQPAFLNQAICVQTPLLPLQLLETCQATEQRAGRERLVRWGARTLDVDILLYDDLVLNTERLTLPHPRLPERRFALVPIAEIAADVMHPGLGKTVVKLLAECTDMLEVIPLKTRGSNSDAPAHISNIRNTEEISYTNNIRLFSNALLNNYLHKVILHIDTNPTFNSSEIPLKFHYAGSATFVTLDQRLKVYTSTTSAGYDTFWTETTKESGADERILVINSKIVSVRISSRSNLELPFKLTIEFENKNLFLYCAEIYPGNDGNFKYSSNDEMILVFEDEKEALKFEELIEL
ncbi:2-amino-4-hydroxy-6-hydroxymethyldihydropteridine diphosphokinase [Hymenobacter sp. DG01]|uniref:2-amino-4-hydroxy-6- hydroxymethyldihydropteridine diphosphokinase n=1 Tax=Hymenobacter sp. DG01 TaxID=2584940 RepID=UPI00111E963F|nr:2-amino-4-hydroxy-6-hydroxymethyldihydropteridine diphosphokinase [Hymenobacter sp. DG01]